MKKTAPKSKSRKSKRVFSWVNPKLEARKSSINGKGIFANKQIRKGEIVGVFGGYIMTLQEIYGGKNKTIQNDHIQFDDYFGIGNIKKKDLDDASYFNHCCNPNAGFQGELTLIATRKIKKVERTDIMIPSFGEKNAFLFGRK